MHSIYKNMQLTLRQVIFLGMDGHHHTVLTKISILNHINFKTIGIHLILRIGIKFIPDTSI